MPATPAHYLKNKRVVITGGTGFIGSHLLTAILANRPKTVRVVSSGSNPDRIEQHLKDVELRTYKDNKSYVRLIAEFKPDYVFILGGNADPRLSVSNPRLDLEFNLLLNFDLLERFSREKSKAKLLYVSSVAVYGDSETPLHEEDSSTFPKSPYGINKLATEGYVRFYANHNGLKAFSVRLSATYGPGLKKQVIYDFIQKLMTDPHQLSVLGNGSEIRDFTYVDDQVDGILFLAGKAAYEGEVYNLGSGRGVSVAELAKKVADTMGLNPKIRFEQERSEEHHARVWVLNTKKVGELGHTAKVNLDEGLRKTIEWVKSQ